MASHELRTPLSVISGAVDLAVKEPELSVPLTNRLARVQNTISDVNELIALHRQIPGIGLALITRLCHHCGRNLSISERSGIHIELAFGFPRAEPA